MTEPGLLFKAPFVQSVNSLDKRFLEWTALRLQIPTSSILSTVFSVSASESRYIVKVWLAGRTYKELLGHSVPARPTASQTPSKNKLFTAARCTSETW